MKNKAQNKTKTETKRLTKNIEENNGICKNRSYKNEKQFQEWLKKWLQDKKLVRKGYRSETKETKTWDKKEEAEITKVRREIQTENGFGDIAIEHDFLNLSWNHVLASPFIIECKKSRSFRKAIEQAVRYKKESSQKYQEKGRYKILNTGIVTPRSLSTGEIASGHEGKDAYPVNFESKRIYWKLGIGVLQSINPNEIVLSFNEGDVVVIK
jgi:hypothetical protein